MSLFSPAYLIVLATVFILGAVIGSFLNVAIYRLAVSEEFWPAFRSLLHPPSHCPRCQHAIRPWHNVPILGWILLGGRCYDCRMSISWRYPAIELLTAVLLSVLYVAEIPPDWITTWQQSGLYHEFGPQWIAQREIFGSVWSAALALHLRFALHAALLFLLITATFIDFDHMIIPDTVTVPGMLLGLVGNTLFGCLFIVPVWYQQHHSLSFQDLLLPLFFENGIPSTWPEWLRSALAYKGTMPAWAIAHPHWHGFAVSLVGWTVGGLLVWGVRWVGSAVLKQEAMGFGDVTLLAMIGSILGWQAALAVFVVAPACALLIACTRWLFHGERELPYGPYLSLATLLILIFWRPFWPAFEGWMLILGPFLPFVGLILLGALAGLLMFWRQVQRWLGYDPDAWMQEPDIWGPGDQLVYLAGENTDQQQGQWPGTGYATSGWPGLDAARGLSQERQWRQGGGPWGA